MDDVRLERIENKLDAMNDTLIRNTVSLEEHVKRTNMLEDSLGRESKVRAVAIEPLQSRYEAQNAIIGALVTITKVLAVVATALLILEKMHLIR